MAKRKTVKKSTKVKAKRVTANQQKQQAYDYMVHNTSLFRGEVLRKLLDTNTRTIDDECGYPQQIATGDYVNMITRNGLADRVNRILPDECWAWTPEITDNSESEESSFEEAWTTIQDRFHVLHYLHRIDILSGIGRFGVLLLGIDDGMTLEQPVAGVSETGMIEEEEIESSGETKLLYIKPFDESVLEVVTKDTDPMSPRFGFPVLYNITFEDTTNQQASQQVMSVHWTRLIHVADNRECSDLYGIPRLRNVYNHLLDIKKVLGGSGEMFWKGGFPGYAFEVNPDIENGTIDKASIREEMADYSQGLQRYLALEGVKAVSLAPQVADPTAHLTSNVKAIAMAKGIPYRIFMGSEEAKLASTEDKKTWNTRVGKRQEDYLTPLLIRALIDRLIQMGVLPVPQDEYTVEWPDMNAPTDKDKAEVALQRTKAFGEYVQKDVANLIPPKEYMTIVLEMEKDDVEAIEEAAEEYEKEMKVTEEEEADKTIAREDEVSDKGNQAALDLQDKKNEPKK